jgi:Zn-finger nucleic acid-binding protein
MTERQSVEIDYCPQCRGVWLDRGELDKLIERSAAWQTRSQPATAATNKSDRPLPAQSAGPPPAQTYRRDHDDDDDDDDDYYRRHGRRKRRGGFLGEIFDFD